MLSSVLHSKRAVEVNVAIMRAFVHLRQVLSAHHDLVRRMDELERQYDGKFEAVFSAIRRLMTPPLPVEDDRRRIGFTADRASRALSRKGGGR